VSELSVVLPAHNAGEAIARSIRWLREQLVGLVDAVEFIVVDDGSSDDTADRMRELTRENPDVRLLSNRQNLGKGMALYLGVFAARHSKVLLTDADAPFSEDSYRRVIGELNAGAPVVIASRRLKDSQILICLDVMGYAARRHLIGLAFGRLVRLLTGLDCSDTQCGLKALDRGVALELFRHLHRGGFVFDIELLLAARERGIPVVEIPVCIVYEQTRSSLDVALDSWRMGVALLAIARRQRRGGYRAPAAALTAQRFLELADESKP
jgi:dolichyl-phosphate beta-glucosyltransferase